MNSESLVSAIEGAADELVIIGSTPLTDLEVWPGLDKKIGAHLRRDEFVFKVVAESDNQLFQHSLRTDARHATHRVTFRQLQFRRSLVQKVSERSGRAAAFSISSLPIHTYVVRVDGVYWYLPVLGGADSLMRFRRMSKGDPWYAQTVNYVEHLLDRSKDGKYTAAPDAELLELFDQDEIPRGIYPRNCFYDTDHYQFVVWCFVFSRDGRLLIHKRGDNAKDNQSMWDKSVGGHVDFTRERASDVSAVRELIEELYEKEKDQQSGHHFSLLASDVSKPVFFGDWRSSLRGPEILNELAGLEQGVEQGEEPWAYYRLRGTFGHNTPRLLPNGKTRKLRVLVDAYLFIANTQLNPDTAKNLSNSEYRLVDLGSLKSWIDDGQDASGRTFKATPDLQYIMTGRFRDVLDEAAQFVKYSGLRR